MGNLRGQRRVRGPSTANAYAVLSFALGQTERITGMVTVTNVPYRPAAVLARTVTSLSALSGGRGPARDRSGSAVGHDRETRCSAAEWRIRGPRDGWRGRSGELRRTVLSSVWPRSRSRGSPADLNRIGGAEVAGRHRSASR